MVKAMLTELSHVDEPLESQKFSEVITRVVSRQEPVIVRREHEDIAAVISLQHLEVLQEAFAQQAAERLAATLNWKQLANSCSAPQEWFDGEEPKPF